MEAELKKQTHQCLAHASRLCKLIVYEIPSILKFKLKKLLILKIFQAKCQTAEPIYQGTTKVNYTKNMAFKFPAQVLFYKIHMPQNGHRGI